MIYDFYISGHFLGAINDKLEPVPGSSDSFIRLLDRLKIKHSNKAAKKVYLKNVTDFLQENNILTSIGYKPEIPKIDENRLLIMEHHLINGSVDSRKRNRITFRKLLIQKKTKPTRNAKRLTDEDKKLIYELDAKGFEINKISTRIGCSSSTVSKYLKLQPSGNPILPTNKYENPNKNKHIKNSNSKMG
jgi:hypothetical protein